jgi:putative SOS response-associated peptidase YedK
LQTAEQFLNFRNKRAEAAPTEHSMVTTEVSGIFEPIHEKAMPVMLMIPNDVEHWLRGHSVDDALKNAEACTGRSDCDPADEKKVALRC